MNGGSDLEYKGAEHLYPGLQLCDAAVHPAPTPDNGLPYLVPTRYLRLGSSDQLEPRQLLEDCSGIHFINYLVNCDVVRIFSIYNDTNKRLVSLCN